MAEESTKTASTSQRKRCRVGGCGSLELDGGHFARGGQPGVGLWESTRWSRARGFCRPQPSVCSPAPRIATLPGSGTSSLTVLWSSLSTTRRACVPRQSTCFSMPRILPPGLGPSHHGTAFRGGLGRAVAVFGFERVHFGARLLLQLRQLAGVLIGLALLLGGFVIQALLLDGHARLAHALALGRVGGGLLARSSRPWRRRR